MVYLFAADSFSLSGHEDGREFQVPLGSSRQVFRRLANCIITQLVVTTQHFRPGGRQGEKGEGHLLLVGDCALFLHNSQS